MARCGDNGLGCCSVQVALALIPSREWRLWALPRVVVGRVAVDNQFFRFVLLEALLY